MLLFPASYSILSSTSPCMFGQRFKGIPGLRVEKKTWLVGWKMEVSFKFSNKIHNWVLWLNFVKLPRPTNFTWAEMFFKIQHSCEVQEPNRKVKELEPDLYRDRSTSISKGLSRLKSIVGMKAVGRCETAQYQDCCQCLNFLSFKDQYFLEWQL